MSGVGSLTSSHLPLKRLLKSPVCRELPGASVCFWVRTHKFSCAQGSVLRSMSLLHGWLLLCTIDADMIACIWRSRLFWSSADSKRCLSLSNIVWRNEDDYGSSSYRQTTSWYHSSHLSHPLQKYLETTFLINKFLFLLPVCSCSYFSLF